MEENKKLRAAREDLRLSREEMAKQLNIGAASIVRWEEGAIPNRYNRERLCEFFRKSLAELGLHEEIELIKERHTEQEENQPVPLAVIPTPRNPLKEHWLLITIVSCVALLGLMGGMIISTLWHPNSIPSTATSTTSGTAIAPCAAAPILVDPIDGQTLNSHTVTFTWEAPRNCLPDGYTVRITTNYDPEAKPWIVDTGWAPTFYKYNFSADGTYYWHIRACKPCTPFQPGNWVIRRIIIHTSLTS